jgi:hypothetical protein
VRFWFVVKAEFFSDTIGNTAMTAAKSLGHPKSHQSPLQDWRDIPSFPGAEARGYFQSPLRGSPTEVTPITAVGDNSFHVE